ncbi:MAG: ATP-dependent helicase [Bacteroidetes bacterium]|nr:MAG: ATP-dependent helicase [Bacteroidota bacterium]
MTFKELGIIDPILKALKSQGYTHPTQIQKQAIPTLLQGRDLLGCAQTGTGKTAAFAVPILQNIYLHNRPNHRGPRKIRALIVTPTRELAIQISESFSAYGKFTGLRNTVIFGGVKQGKQVNQLKQGVDILVATPGRLLDLISQKIITLDHIKYSVLDEADHMLDMGFIHDIRKIIALLPTKRQSLFFSATMPPDIVALSKKILGNPQKVTVKPQQATAERVEQALYYVAKQDKLKLLIHLLKTKEADSTLVFSRTKYGSDKIVKKLIKAGIEAAAIHGNKSQNARQRALSAFKEGKVKVLVATDIAARGIDVDDLALVINYDLPNVPETYVHRIGRTGRAKASGIALSFCAQEEKTCLRDIQKLIKQKITVIDDHPFPDDGSTQDSNAANNPQKSNRPSSPTTHRNNNRRRKNYKHRNKRRRDSGKIN